MREPDAIKPSTTSYLEWRHGPTMVMIGAAKVACWSSLVFASCASGFLSSPPPASPVWNTAKNRCGGYSVIVGAKSNKGGKGRKKASIGRRKKLGKHDFEDDEGGSAGE